MSIYVITKTDSKPLLFLNNNFEWVEFEKGDIMTLNHIRVANYIAHSQYTHKQVRVIDLMSEYMNIKKESL